MPHRKILYLRYRDIISKPVPSKNATKSKIKSVEIDEGVYEGLLNSHGKRNGKGKLTYKDSRCYTGDFENNLFHGHGVWKIPGELVYEGKLFHLLTMCIYHIHFLLHFR